MAFQRWPLQEDQEIEKVVITIDELELPRVGDPHASDPVLRNYLGQQYLRAGNSGPPQLEIKFSVDPDPRQVMGLTKFAVQLVSEDSGPTGVTTFVSLGRTFKTTFKAKLKKLRTADLEQGWHYIRVLPQDEDGIPLPVEQSSGEGRYLNESDRFYVVTGDDVDEPESPPRITKDVGITQALRRLEFAALGDGRDWRKIRCQSITWKGTQGSGRHTLHGVFGAHGQVEIPLAPSLTELELQILSDPTRAPGWRLPINADRAGQATHDESTWPRTGGEELEAFLSARRSVFDALGGMVMEGCDLANIRQVAQRYAESYGELLNRQLYRAERAESSGAPGLLRDLALLLQVDCIAVDYTDPQGIRHEMTLVAPTHPLRLLWLVTWAELGHRWLNEAEENDSRTIVAAGRSLAAMTPMGFPLVVPRAGGMLTLSAGDLTPYWGICLPTDTEDPQALMSALTSTLRLPERWIGAQAVSGKRLADRIEQYLRLHPYVSTLVISAVNAGRGESLADMLVALQRRKGLETITYDLRLFTADPDLPGMGDALAQLLRGEWESTVHAEVFHTLTAAGKPPKLAVAVRPLAEFRSAGSEHSAHVTLLFDAFSGERFDAVAADIEGLAPVHGLQQDVVVLYDKDEDPIAWHKQPRYGKAHAIPGAAELSDLLASLPETVSAAASAVTTGQAGTRLVPRITLSLDVADSTLLHQAHRSSDWVITVDRTLGMEYFDNPSSARHPDYLIDIDTGGAEGLGHHLVISSRSVEELRSLLGPVLAQHRFEVDAHHTATFFDQLRLLSGRLAFKLASSAPTQRTEVLGLALARLYLDYQGVLADQILVPLDAHLELYREVRQRVDVVGETVGLQRTDLALFSLDARRRAITCRLVEVKCYSSLSDYDQLTDKITIQLRRSETVLAERFDPHRTLPDRPDRVLLSAEFVSLLRPYLSRAERYKTMRPEAAAEARWLLNCLDRGYRLEFTRAGLVFDLAGSGTGVETEAGIQFHRIGRDLAEELISAIPTDVKLPTDRSLAELTSETLSQLHLTTLPRLTEAAFRAPVRSHEIPDEGLLPTLDDPYDDGPVIEEAASAGTGTCQTR